MLDADKALKSPPATPLRGEPPLGVEWAIHFPKPRKVFEQDGVLVFRKAGG